MVLQLQMVQVEAFKALERLEAFNHIEIKISLTWALGWPLV